LREKLLKHNYTKQEVLEIYGTGSANQFIDVTISDEAELRSHGLFDDKYKEHIAN
jgi:hypothetical protein